MRTLSFRGRLRMPRTLVSGLEIIGGAAALAGVSLFAQPAPAGAPVVYAAAVDSIIHPVSAEFMTSTIEAADQANAHLVLFTLNTPGGLVDSTRDIVTRMLAARTPVVVFVGPAGARAASAGFILTIAADAAAMAPGTHIGAAHPVAGGGRALDETASKKAAQDVAAYTRSLATRRQRNVPLAEQAVNDSRAFTEQEAVSASPPLVDLIASDVGDLLQKLDGRIVTRFDGSTTTLRTANPRIVSIAMTWRQRILSAIAHPNIAYMLLSLGMLGLTIELWSPGAIIPGVVGGVALLLAFFALRLLPVNYAGLLLIVLGLALLGLEIKVTSYGLLTVGGAVSLIFGSMILVDSTSPGLRLSLRLVIPVVVAFVAMAVLLVRLGLAAQRQSPVTGAEAMIGQTGRALTPIEPGRIGQVAVHGEIWQARTADRIAANDPVRIVEMDGLILSVHKE
jgi:membrane-bound serine protease (ClpP class)